MVKKKIIFIFLFLSLLILTGAGFWLIRMKAGKQGQVCLKNKCFKVELAITRQEREQGLMFRKSLKEDRGMLFIFSDEGEYPFWMKNTLIPLDIIWINLNKEIVFIAENAQPCSENECISIMPDKEAEYVLELKGGTAKNINLTVGDKADIKISGFIK